MNSVYDNGNKYFKYKKNVKLINIRRFPDINVDLSLLSYIWPLSLPGNFLYYKVFNK